MIAYDDLVAALTAWRARQGLPIAASAAPPARAPVPPRPPPGRAVAADADLDDGGLIEDASYDASGVDYVMQLGSEQPGEPTAIGAAPEPPRRGKRW